MYTLQSITKSIIQGFERLGSYRITTLGGTKKTHYVSPKGLYSKSLLSTNALTFQILKDAGNTISIPLQNAIDLNDGDVILTDDSNHIHFKNIDNYVEMLGDFRQFGDYEHIGDRIQTGNHVTTGNITATQTIAASNFTGLNGATMTANVDITTSGKLRSQTLNVNGEEGVSGTFTTNSNTVTVTNGIITQIS